jgi:hypothetical protein
MNITSVPTASTYYNHGTAVVRSTAIDGGNRMFFEISTIRTWRQKNPTFQGTVFYRDNAWVAEISVGGKLAILGTYPEHRDAVDALLARRTGRTSCAAWAGPRPAEPVYPKCGVCGNRKAAWGGPCSRPELHWNPAEQTEAALHRDLTPSQRRRTAQLASA